MRRSSIRLGSIAAVTLLFAFVNPPASAKTTAECNAEYQANKAAIKSAGTKKADFMTACKAGTETIPAGTSATSSPAEPAPVGAAAPAAPPEAAIATNPATTPSGGKTVSACNAEYAANKEAIKAAGQKKKDFVASCRAGTEVIPTAAAQPAPPTAASAPATTAAPAPASTPMSAPTAAAPMLLKPSATASAAVAGGFASDAQAKAKCPSDTVVWVNTRSGIYHFAGTHNYGHTKQGTYMCEADAKAAGDRAAENEKHP